MRRFFPRINLAKRARSEFEQAVNLDPHDGEALTDLGEFYSSAPGVVGGGNDKAQALVPRWSEWTRRARTYCWGALRRATKTSAQPSASSNRRLRPANIRRLRG